MKIYLIIKKLIPALIMLPLIACNNTPGTVSAPPSTSTAGNRAKVNETASDQTISFDTYYNARFGYCIDYPQGIIYPQPEAQNGDGRVFKNKQGETILTVYGRMNADPDGSVISLEQQYDDDLHSAPGYDAHDDRVITYQKLGKTFFVISGYKKGRIFYQKTILKDDAFAYAILEYDENEKDLFDKVSDRVFKSFK